jgi:ankyrin repeat protein
MPLKNRSYMYFRVLLLISIYTLFCTFLCTGESLAQNQANIATEKLKVLFEFFFDVDTAEISKLIKAGADVNVKNKDGATLLYIAAEKDHAVIVKQLLSSGADVNIPDETDGATPLLITSEKGHTDIVKQLLVTWPM